MRACESPSACHAPARPLGFRAPCSWPATSYRQGWRGSAWRTSQGDANVKRSAASLGHRHSGAAPAVLLTPSPTPAQENAAHAVRHQQERADGHDNVPSTLPEALRVFFTHPSTVVALVLIAAAAAFRVQCGAGLTVCDAVVGGAAAAGWVVQEWAIHKFLLHSSWDWLGKQIHVAHHMQPYHHVSIDGPEVVGGFMVLVAAVFTCLIKPLGGDLALVATACVCYWTTGLLSYQLVHMLVHTRWVPRSGFMRRVRRHHMLHHLRNHHFWFAFSLPAMDEWAGTAPNPARVPLNTYSRGEKTMAASSN